VESLEEQLARRDRFLRHQRLSETPAERMRAMAALQEATWNQLLRSPNGYAHFLRRNFKARAIDVPPSGSPHAS